MAPRLLQNGIALDGLWLDPAQLLDREVYAAMREAAGLDQIEMAQLLTPGQRIKTSRTIQHYEGGSRGIKGAVAVATAYLLQGAVKQAGDIALPTHLLSPAGSGMQWVVRLRTPRYLGLLAEYAVTGEAVAHPSGLVVSVVLWIDAPQPARLPGLAAQVPLPALPLENRHNQLALAFGR